METRCLRKVGITLESVIDSLKLTQFETRIGVDCPCGWEGYANGTVGGGGIFPVGLVFCRRGQLLEGVEGRMRLNRHENSSITASWQFVSLKGHFQIGISLERTHRY